jgi:Flp pilus assembly protein TadD
VPGAPEPQRSGDANAAPVRWGWYGVHIALFALALLSKPSAAALPLGLFVLDRWMLRRSWRACALGVLPSLLLALPAVAVTRGAQPVSAEDVAPLWQRPFVAADALAFYLGKLFVPAHLTIDYGRKPVVIFRHGWAYWTWLVPVAVGIAATFLGKRRPWIAAGLLFSVVMLLPVLGLVPFGYQDFSTVADRYVYLPMFGPALLLAGGLDAARGTSVRAGRGWALAAAAWLVLLGVQTRRHVACWDNSLTLFAYAVRENPLSYQIRNNYGITLAEAGRLGPAIVQLRTAIAQHPYDPDAYVSLGRALRDSGDLPGAQAALETAVAQDPGAGRAHQNLGIVLFREKRYPEAAAQLAQAAALMPAMALNHSDYGGCLLPLGRTDEAIKQFRLAIALDPTLAGARTGLAQALLQAGSPDALAAFQDAVRADPDNASDHADLAILLSQQGRTDEAIAEDRKAEALAPGDDQVHYNLGYLLLHAGWTDDAVSELRQAVRCAPNSADNHDELGVALAVGHDFAGARAEFQKALALNPNSADARKHFAMLGGAASSPQPSAK